MNDNPNPPAFSCPGSEGVSETGMSLRDWFAGKVISECLRNSREAFDNGENHLDVDEIPKQAAIDSYIIADAMLTARHQPPTP